MWSSKKIPGAEARSKPGIRTYLKTSHSFADKARPFSIWRPDLKVLGFHCVGRCGKLAYQRLYQDISLSFYVLFCSQAGAAAGGNTFQQGLRTNFSALSFYHGRLEMCLLVSLELYRVNRQEFGWCWCWEHYCHVFVCVCVYDIVR